MTKLIHRPTSRRGLLLAVGAGVLTLGLLAFAAVYFLLFPTSSPKPFSLGAAAGASTTPTVASQPSSLAPAGTGIAGGWVIAGGSQAGYRVREKLGFLPAQSDAVGRTSSITGSATLADAAGIVSVTAASFKIAVNTLKSDQSMRDEKIHTIGLESDTYPTATFALSSAVRLPSSALNGSVVHVPVSGMLEIHGTARRETITVELKLSSSTIEAVGSLTFPWSDFKMTAPSIGGFVNVTDKATMEFSLHLKRA